MPERKAAARRQARVRENLHLLPKEAQEAILESFKADGVPAGAQAKHSYEDPDTTSIPAHSRY